MVYFWAIFTIAMGYICGSIPVGYWIGLWRGVDLLSSGSGKIGGTNVFRSVGLLPALFSIFGDVFKGLIPTWIVVNLAGFGILPVWVVPLTGAAAVLGHNHSVFIKFRGGVGAVTALAALAAISFPAALVSAVVAVIAVLITRFASMASFSGSVTGLIMLIILSAVTPQEVPPIYILYGVLAVALVSWGLRNNFARIRAGTERRIGVPEQNIKTISH